MVTEGARRRKLLSRSWDGAMRSQSLLGSRDEVDLGFVCRRQSRQAGAEEYLRRRRGAREGQTNGNGKEGLRRGGLGRMGREAQGYLQKEGKAKVL